MTASPREARELAGTLLAAELPRRWAHVVGVATRARAIDYQLGSSGVLEASAWVHDIGYARKLASRGFHPLDGACYLRDIHVSERVAGLVAFHSAATFEAEKLGLTAALFEFEDERTLVRDLLWYLDMTTSPDGNAVTFGTRMAELRQRYPSDHYVIQALDVGMPERVAAVERAEAWLASAGLAGQV